MSDEKLLPCPFCGAEVNMGYDHTSKHRTGKSYYQVECGECGATAGCWYDVIEKAAENWNKRSAADEIIRLKEELAEARKSADIAIDERIACGKALEAAHQEIAGLKGDAERYRWLRDNNNGGMVEVSISDTESGMAWLYKEHDLDAAIDAAMQGKDK